MYPVIRLVITDVTKIIILIPNDTIGSFVSFTVNYVTEMVDVIDDIKRDHNVFICKIVRNSNK